MPCFLIVDSEYSIASSHDPRRPERQHPSRRSRKDGRRGWRTREHRPVPNVRAEHGTSESGAPSRPGLSCCQFLTLCGRQCGVVKFGLEHNIGMVVVATGGKQARFIGIVFQKIPIPDRSSSSDPFFSSQRADLLLRRLAQQRGRVPPSPPGPRRTSATTGAPAPAPAVRTTIPADAPATTGVQPSKPSGNEFRAAPAAPHARAAPAAPRQQPEALTPAAPFRVHLLIMPACLANTH